jgi:hypothetical protein
MADHQPSLSTPKLDWQEKFEAVLLEEKPEKAPQLVADAEAAIFLRLQSLVDSPDGKVERDALTDAIRTLRAIQTKKLHYPDRKDQ